MKHTVQYCTKINLIITVDMNIIFFSLKCIANICSAVSGIDVKDKNKYGPAYVRVRKGRTMGTYRDFEFSSCRKIVH